MRGQGKLSNLLADKRSAKKAERESRALQDKASQVFNEEERFLKSGHTEFLIIANKDTKDFNEDYYRVTDELSERLLTKGQASFWSLYKETDDEKARQLFDAACDNLAIEDYQIDSFETLSSQDPLYGRARCFVASVK